MKSSKKTSLIRGQQGKRVAKPTRPYKVCVRLSAAELARLKRQVAQDGREKSEILRDWFNQAPEPEPLPQLRVRRMGAFELDYYRQLLDLGQKVWNLAEQARRLDLPAVQAQALLALAAIQELASSLVPLPSEDVMSSDWTAADVYYDGELFVMREDEPGQKTK